MKNIFLSFLLLLTVSIVAQEHAPVAVRHESEKVTKEREKEAQGSDESSISEEKAGCFCFNFNWTNLSYGPQPSHWVCSFCNYGDALDLEDGSIWVFNPFEAYHTRYWLPNDPVILTQNREWFSSYQFRIRNLNDGTSVAVNLSAGPIIGGEYTRQITNVDHYHGLVVLSDGSHWTVSWRDRSAFAEWILGDYIMIGVNSGWDSSCPIILINSNMNDFIRVRPY